MNDFDTLFPNFLNQCAEMNRVLTPIAFVLLAVGIISSTVTGHRSASAYLRTIGRTLAFAAVLAYLGTWGNEIGTVVDSTVKNTLKADPAGVYDQYQKALVVQKGTTGDKSWWDLLDAQAIFESVVSAFLIVLGFLASVIVFYAYLVQKFILYVGYALAPIFIGFLAVRTLHSIGVGFLLGYAGVLCWPLGWGAASLLTSGLIDFMTDQSFFSFGAIAGGAGYSLQNLMGLAALAIWLISSTIAGPIIIQKAIATGAQVGTGTRGYHGDSRRSLNYRGRGSCGRTWRERRSRHIRNWPRWRRRSRGARSHRSVHQRQFLLTNGQPGRLAREPAPSLPQTAASHEGRSDGRSGSP